MREMRERDVERMYARENESGVQRNNFKEGEYVVVCVCDWEPRQKSVGHTIILMVSLHFLLLFFEKENILTKCRSWLQFISNMSTIVAKWLKREKKISLFLLQLNHKESWTEYNMNTVWKNVIIWTFIYFPKKFPNKYENRITKAF